ncbi:MAG TPA: hypothetical protein PLN53_06550 [Terricaulis sp.]|nr:hypothetical protein [Terricaulis sp.]
MRVLILIALTFGVLGQAFAQDVLGPEQFRDTVAAAMRQADPGADVEVDGPLKLGILLEDGRGVSADLDDMYQRYLSDPSAGPLLAAGWARSIVGGGDQSDAARWSIVALVRPRDAVSRLAPDTEDQSSPLAARSFAGDLVEVLAVHNSGAFRLVTQSVLAELRISEEDAWRLSRINIVTRLPQPRVTRFAPGVIAMSAANGLGPSALTDPIICRVSDADQRLFLVLDEDTILVADRRFGVDMPALRDQLLSAGATASRTIMACRNGRLVDYDGV